MFSGAKEKMEEIKRTPIEMLFNGIQGLITIFVCGYFVMGYSDDAESCFASHNQSSTLPLSGI